MMCMFQILLQMAAAEIKLPLSNCVVCYNVHKEFRRIQSQAGQQKALGKLLLKYGDVNVVEGVICRPCERRLIHLDDECCRFRIQCQTTCSSYSVKRCSISSSNPTVCRTPLCQIQLDPMSTPAESTSPRQKVTKISHDSVIAVTSKPDRSRSEYATILPANKLPPMSQSGTELSESADSSRSCSKTVAELIAENFSVHPVDHCLTTSQYSDIITAARTKSLTAIIDSIATVATDSFQHRMLEEIDTGMNKLKTKKRGTPSVLLHTSVGKSTFETLTDFSWDDCVEEFRARFPSVCNLIVGMMLGKERRMKACEVASTTQRLAMIYAMIVQCHIPYLSRAQRLLSAVLTDSLVDVKVRLSYSILVLVVY